MLGREGEGCGGSCISSLLPLNILDLGPDEFMALLPLDLITSNPYACIHTHTHTLTHQPPCLLTEPWTVRLYSAATSDCLLISFCFSFLFFMCRHGDLSLISIFSTYRCASFCLIFPLFPKPISFPSCTPQALTQ